jgi:phage shock protein PspC (stress-responsive transcriptional regulator)
VKRLRKSPTDRIVSGVCGGVAEYFGVDANLVRLLWIVSIVLGCVGVLPYVAAYLLLPEEEGVHTAPPTAKLVGFVLLAAGVLLLLRTFDARVLDPTVLAFWKFHALGPVILLVAGGLLVWPGARSFLGTDRKPRRSVTDRVLGGVAGGIAADLRVDANLVRLAFVAAAGLTFGLAVLLYILLVLVVAEEDVAVPAPPPVPPPSPGPDPGGWPSPGGSDPGGWTSRGGPAPGQGRPTGGR